MANEGTRGVVQDPLAPNPREQRPNRSLQVGGVQTPQIPSAASLTTNDGLTQALQGIEGVLQQEFEKKKDGWITEGKVAYQSGVTEAAMLESGNAFTAQGYRTLQARDQVNNWYVNQNVAMDETGKKMDPQEYAANLKSQRAEILKGITDPHAQKVASAAFEDMSPRLAQSQAIKHNEYNRVEGVKAFSAVLSSTGATSATASRRDPGGQLAISPVPVGPTLTTSAKDRDVGIRTMLGEAGNQGAEGLAAVAHVMRNRTTDARWPNTIEGVALQPKQFSTWNAGAGGNAIPYNAKPGSPAYERAGEVFDAVMAGKHVDPTGGATHYYSPTGMQKLVADGDQKNVIPKWLDDETARSGGRVKIGGHIFVGKSTSADKAQAPQNEVQQIIDYSNLKPEDKAAAVADAMRRTLDAGDEKLFNDAGGLSKLHSLSAKPSDIDEVIKARKRYDDKKLTEFSAEGIKFENDIKARAEKGEALDSILTDITKRRDRGLMNDAQARVLATNAADKIRAEGGAGSQMTNPDFLQEVGGLFQAVSSGSIELPHAIEQAKATAAHHGAKEKDVQRIIGKMFSDDQSRQDRLRHIAEEAAKKKIEQDGYKAAVERAIAKGGGLDNVTGTITVPNAVSGQPGENISAKDYGIRQIKDKWGRQYADAVNEGNMNAGQAVPALNRMVALELQEHGIVDPDTQRQIQGGLTGNIIGKDGKLKPETVKAYSTWLTLRETPNLSPAYLSRLVPDSDTRSLLESAYKMDTQDLTRDEALLKAHEIKNDPNRDPNDKLAKDVTWRKKMDVDVQKALVERTHPGFISSFFATKDNQERERIVFSPSNTGIAKNYVTRIAEERHIQHPNEDADVSLEIAIQDLQRNSTPVMGNLIIHKPGKELDKTMGVAGYGPQAAEEAISNFIRTNGEKIWGKAYAAQQSDMLGSRDWGDAIGNSITGKKTGYDRQSKVAGAASTLGTIDRQFSPQGIARAISPRFESADDLKGSRSDAPPVHIAYNPETGDMSVDLYADAERKSTLGQVKHFRVQDIGAAYVKEKNTVTGWDNIWKGAFKGSVGFLKSAADDYNKTVGELK